MMTKTKPRLWTKNGLQQLGDLIKEAREARGWSQRVLAGYIKRKTGHGISDTSVSGLENGREPKWNTLAIIAAAEFIKKPTGTPYTVEEFAAIASETFLNNASEGCVTANEDEYYLPIPSFKAARRLKNLVLATGQRRGWSESDFRRAGVDPELYTVILNEDWVQPWTRDRPAKILVASLAVYLYKVEHWENDVPTLGESCYLTPEELWAELEPKTNGNLIHC